MDRISEMRINELEDALEKIRRNSLSTVSKVYKLSGERAICLNSHSRATLEITAAEAPAAISVDGGAAEPGRLFVISLNKGSHELMISGSGEVKLSLTGREPAID